MGPFGNTSRGSSFRLLPVILFTLYGLYYYVSNRQAVPLIDQEIPDQGVNFLSVIGATVTSEGYRSSLQAILDSLGK